VKSNRAGKKSRSRQSMEWRISASIPKKVDLNRANLLDCWIFWLNHAQEYEARDLAELFPQEPIRGATMVIQKISEKTEDKLMYDLREKAIRDRKNELDSARLEGKKEGERQG